MVAFTRPQRAYDHRLHELVYHSGLDPSHVGIAIPRSTLHTWKSRAPKPVVGLVTSDHAIEKLESEVARLTLQVRKLRCLLRLVVAILKLSGFSLELTRLPEGRMTEGTEPSANKRRSPKDCFLYALRVLAAKTRLSPTDEIFP
jgi:hypothetical protein